MSATQTQERAQALTDLLRRGLAIGRALRAAMDGLDLAAFDRALFDLAAWGKEAEQTLPDERSPHDGTHPA